MNQQEFKSMCEKYNTFYDKMTSELSHLNDFDKLILPSINDFIKVKKWEFESDGRLNEFDRIKDEMDKDEYLTSLKNKELKLKRKQRKIKLERQLDEMEKTNKLKI
jgi:hypothetical protein